MALLEMNHIRKHFGGLDIRAVLYSHSHIDHYGGIFGLLSQEDAADASLTLEEGCDGA